MVTAAKRLTCIGCVGDCVGPAMDCMVNLDGDMEGMKVGLSKDGLALAT